MFRIIARSLNTKCDFKHGFFSCDLSVDAVQISVWVDTRHGKHTLREDRCQQTEKYKTWVKHNDDQRQVLDSMMVSDLSNSGDWISHPEFNYKPKLFDDPRNADSSKENMPPLESIATPTFNTGEQEFLNRREKLLDTRNNWKSHVAQQILLPRPSSPTHTDKQPGSLEQLEVDTGDDMDIRNFSERPTNDMKPPKLPRKTKAYIMDIIPPPGCPDYMAMNHAVMGIPKPPLPEIRSLLTEKRKVPIRWLACLKRSPPKAAFNNNDIYVKSTDDGENFYKEPQEQNQ